MNAPLARENLRARLGSTCRGSFIEPFLIGCWMTGVQFPEHEFTTL